MGKCRGHFRISGLKEESKQKTKISEKKQLNFRTIIIDTVIILAVAKSEDTREVMEGKIGQTKGKITRSLC